MNCRGKFGQGLICLVCTFALATNAHAASVTTTYTYDSLGRLTSVAYSDGHTITYTYDAAGNRVNITIS